MIRDLTARDHDLFLALCDEFYHSPAVAHPIPAAFYENTFQELMRSDVYAKCYILEHEDIPAGYALLSRSYSAEAGGPVVWIEELYLRPRFRCHGLGSEFFAFLEEHHPAARYRLEIEPDNERAARLYRSRGFEVLPYVQMIKDMK